MTCVLIVDGEADGLEELCRQLHSAREEWEMHVVATPREALGFMDVRAPDVVVIDLAQMVDGVKLLLEVEKRQPNAVRIVTSTQAEHRSYVESIGVAHQFLQKPVEPDSLMEAIARACALRRWAVRPGVVSSVRRYGRPPRLPQVYRALVQAVQRDASLAEIGAIVGSDPAMTARLLQVANSAFFAPRHPITSAELATSFLGLEMVRAIVIFEGIAGAGSAGPVVDRRVHDIWRHSLEIAATAQRLADHEKLPRDQVASAFSLGVMHDLGAILLARHHDPIDAGDQRHSAEEIERERHGVAHTEAGACLVLDWGLPDDVVEVLAFHHEPLRFGTTSRPTAGFLVAAACAFRDVSAAGPDPRAVERLSAALAARGLADRLDPWHAVADHARQPAATKPVA